LQEEIEEYETEALKAHKQELKNVVNITYSALAESYKMANDQERLKLVVADQLKNSLNLVYLMLEEKYRQALKVGTKRAMAAAERESIEYIKRLRFGSSGKDYVWI